MRAAVLFVAVTLVASAHAKSFAPRTDIDIIALDLETGALKWTHDGPELGNAHFELYRDALAVYPHYDPSDKSKPFFIDVKTGTIIVEDKRDPKKLVKTSSAQWIKGPIVLSNGWRADSFDPGNTKNIEFTDPKTNTIVWTIKPAHYPEFVRAYKDLALVAYGYLTDEAMLFAHRAGTTKPAWSIDFNKLLGKPTKKKALDRLGRVQHQIIDDVLYAQTGEHIFAIAPATGKILWRLDAAATLGIKYEPELYGGALDVAVFTKDADVLVVSFEKRLLAVRASTGTLLWSMVPDTFPHTAFPLAHAGVVYLSSGPKRGNSITPTKTAAR